MSLSAADLALPWQQRNTKVEGVARAALAFLKTGAVLTSWELALLIGPTPAQLAETRKLAQILTRIAPHLGPLATHDGETVTRFGKQLTRWRWHGQNGGTNV